MAFTLRTCLSLLLIFFYFVVVWHLRSIISSFMDTRMWRRANWYTEKCEIEKECWIACFAVKLDGVSHSFKRPLTHSLSYTSVFNKIVPVWWNASHYIGWILACKKFVFSELQINNALKKYLHVLSLAEDCVSRLSLLSTGERYVNNVFYVHCSVFKFKFIQKRNLNRKKTENLSVFYSVTVSNHQLCMCVPTSENRQNENY